MFCRTQLFLCLALSLLWLTAPAPLQAQEINGAGSTFAAPLYVKWFQEYKAQTGVTVNYRAFGSSGGIKNITAHAIDFAASDAPMNDAEMQAAPGILHIPTVAHAVTVVYNLPGINTPLHLTGPVIADIYLGRITRWNDPRLARLNPNVPLPDLAVFPVHASNGSGTTYIFTTYLSAVSPQWKESVGAGKAVHWPFGLGGKSEYMQLIKGTEGSIGYTELNYAVPIRIPYAALQNARGNFVSPTIEATDAAAASAKTTPDMRGSIVNAPAPLGYPLVGYTYLLIYKNGAKPAVKDLLTWCLTTGQHDATDLLYAPLPPTVQKRALALVNSMK